MRRLLVIILSLVSLSVSAGVMLAPSAAMAYDAFHDACAQSNPSNGVPEVCNTPANAPDPISGANGIIVKVVNILSIIIGIASVIMIIIGGLRYVLSNGDSNSINGAKNQILYALVGLVVAAAAQSIIVFVINKL